MLGGSVGECREYASLVGMARNFSKFISVWANSRLGVVSRQGLLCFVGPAGKQP